MDHNRRLERERDAATAASLLARETQDFLVGMFQSPDPFTPADPERGRRITVVEALALGRDRLEEDFADQPALRATLLSTIGEVLTRLDQTDEAYEALDQALATRIGSATRCRRSSQTTSPQLPTC